jgi:hypothetical protein
MTLATFLALLPLQGESPSTGPRATPPAVEEPRGWTFDVASYVWLTGISGTVQVGSTSANVNETFDDLLDITDFVGSIHVEAAKSSWILFGDVLYGKLSDDEGVAGFDFDVESTMTIAELGGAYRFENPSWLQVLAGGRLFGFTADVKVKAPGPLGMTTSESGSQAWIDPFVGARLTADLDEKWYLALRTDVGGFDVGSNLSVNFVSGVGYRLSNAVDLRAGFRVLTIDYDQGTGDDRFSFDGQFSGLFTAIGFRF